MRQGTHGDTFYIISEGQVRVTKRVEGNDFINSIGSTRFAGTS